MNITREEKIKHDYDMEKDYEQKNKHNICEDCEEYMDLCKTECNECGKVLYCTTKHDHYCC